MPKMPQKCLWKPNQNQNLKYHTDQWPITYLLMTQDAYEQPWLNSLKTSWLSPEHAHWVSFKSDEGGRNGETLSTAAEFLMMKKVCDWSHSLFSQITEVTLHTIVNPEIWFFLFVVLIYNYLVPSFYRAQKGLNPQITIYS